MQPGQLALRLVPVLATSGASSQFLIQAAQPLQQMVQRFLVLIALTIGKRCQPIEPHVDADRRMGVDRSFIGHLHRDRNKPPVRRFADACRQDFASKTQVLRHVDPSELGNVNPVIAHAEFVVGQVEGLA